MEKEERILMLEEERETVFVELITEIGWVFHHPILREWIKVAPSINSIDSWIMTQFQKFEHKIELVKTMRKAVKTWKMTDSDTRKNLLKTPKKWRLSDIFIFSPNQTSFRAENNNKSNLVFADAIKFLPEPQKAILCDSWPLFLREFGYNFNSRGLLRTSLDSLSNEANQFWSVEKMGERFWCDKTAEAFRGKLVNLIDLLYKIDFRQKDFNDDKKVAWTDILLEKFGIGTQIIKVEPRDGEIYPRFYKTVFFRDKNYNQLIRILWPIDCFHDDQKGWLGFSKSIKLNDQMKVVLNLAYNFDNDFKLIATPEHVLYDPHSHIQIQISGVQQSLLFQRSCPVPKREVVLEAVEILFENFVEAWEFSIQNRNVSLHSILGTSLLKSPPDSLLQFFTG